MRRKIPYCIFLLLLFTSCSGLGLRKSHVHYFDKSFSAVVENKPFKTIIKNGSKESLLNLFEKKDIADSVSIRFTDSYQLVLSYESEGQQVEQQFDGHFKKKGYYEFYIRKQICEIPPLVPFLYSNNKVSRLRLALTPEGDLIVDHYWDYSKNILILGVGRYGRQSSFFKCRK